MNRRTRCIPFCSLFLSFAVCLPLHAEAPAAAPTAHESIEVTATRTPEDPIEVPASIQIVSGDDLDRRHATTLAEALALVGGVTIAPGGDAGPASSVPEMMGLREFDAFLLVVDDVPWGGAFNPSLSTLDLTNVDRIEILRGSAPVLYGATSFVGVIHVIHRAPGSTPGELRVSGGSFGTVGAAVSADLPGSSAWKQAITANYDRTGFRDDQTKIGRGHLLYRGAGELGGGRLRLDLNAIVQKVDPASPTPFDGSGRAAGIPLDANHNPSDRRLDQNQFHLALAYDHAAMGGDWTTRLAVTSSNRKSIRGFLREAFVVAPDESNADGFRQTLDQTDVYFDTHLAWHPSKELAVVLGMDELYGKGTMGSDNFEYHVAPDGSGAPSAAGIRIDERPHLEDRRSFAGLYAQGIWTPAPRWRFEAGARLNSTREKRFGEVRPGDDGSGGAEGESRTQSVTRGGGSVGASFLASGDKDSSIWLFADYRNTFKPAAIDFGPEAEGDILKPEDADMVEAGIKGAQMGGTITWEVSAFHMNFSNLVVPTVVDGLPGLKNAGHETFDGFEGELKWLLTRDLSVQATCAYHDAKYGDYVNNDTGVPDQFRGNRLEMSAKHLAAFGLFYLPADGVNVDVVASYVGDRFLDGENTALVPGYTTWGVGIGYRFGKAEVRVDGTNLGDKRDPVANSELGAGQEYLLPARSIVGSFVWRF